jgi:hypothetical protein
MIFFAAGSQAIVSTGWSNLHSAPHLPVADADDRRGGIFFAPSAVTSLTAPSSRAPPRPRIILCTHSHRPILAVRYADISYVIHPEISSEHDIRVNFRLTICADLSTRSL